jgi:hypothetical protein
VLAALVLLPLFLGAGVGIAKRDWWAGVGTACLVFFLELVAIAMYVFANLEL